MEMMLKTREGYAITYREGHYISPTYLGQHMEKLCVYMCPESLQLLSEY
jgi:hypothetical protein